MAITELFTGTKTGLSTTEWSMTANAAYSAGTNRGDDGVFQLFLDLNDMVAADDLQILIYEKITSGGTQRIIYSSNVFGPQSPPAWVSPSLVLMHGWDMTIKANVGTIDIPWSIRQVA